MNVFAVLAPDTTPMWAWATFAAVVVTALSIDLLLVNRTAHVQTVRQAGVWVAVWVGLAILFNVLVFSAKGHAHALEFSTAYLIELSLSVDNLFIFLVIFKFFGVKPEYQHRTLFWGILGAVVMRGIFIAGGVWFLGLFWWLVFGFGGLLIVTGSRLFFSKEEAHDPSKTFAYRLAKRCVPLTDRHHGRRFFIVEEGKRLATPLFMVLVAIEATDLVFAVDSIPACLAISRDAFVVYSSNIFAILGLRSLYFLLSGAVGSLRFLKPALSVVLIFIGVKMIVAEIGGPPAPAAPAVAAVSQASAAGADATLPAIAVQAAQGHLSAPTHPYKIPTSVSLVVVAAILGLAVLGSLLFPKKPDDTSPGKDAPLWSDEEHVQKDPGSPQ